MIYRIEVERHSIGYVHVQAESAEAAQDDARALANDLTLDYSVEHDFGRAEPFIRLRAGEVFWSGGSNGRWVVQK